MVLKHVYYHVRIESPVYVRCRISMLGAGAREDPEGCRGQGGGRGDHVSDRMYTRGGFMSMYGKTNTVL